MSLLQLFNLSLPAAAGSQPAAAKKAAGGAAVPAQKAKQLSQAAEKWRQTHAQANERIAALKAAVKAHCADAPPALVQEIAKGLLKLDEVLNAVDHRLADSMASAGSADDHGAHKAELKNAKAILTEYIGYVKSESLVAHVDQNPFNVKTDLKALLVGGLTHAAKAIG
ncbi:MAG: hypothetical protein ABJA61_02570 [Caldimonas sp.]